MSARAYVDLARPFTLLPPALGVLSGAVTAWGSAHAGKPPVTWDLAADVVWGTLMAAVLNAGNNAINQIYDLDIDRVNKPKRPLPSGALTLGQAWGFTIASFLLAWVLAWLVNPVGRRECFWIVIFTSLLCWAYSAPPLWTKRRGFLANITIAIPRGVLLKVAGWSTVLSVLDGEPWYIGSVFGLFLLGAASTKDFSDMEGDKAGGCTTLPIVYGVKKAAWIIAPFFVLPFALIPIGVGLRILTGNPVLLNVLGITLVLYGCYTVYLLVRRPEELAATENHPSWTHMYRMMMVAQIGFALAYVF
jgi:4-hydroxybenzoate polyprenyltransferase